MGLKSEQKTILNIKVQILFQWFLNFTHTHIPAEAQKYATLPDQNLKGERGGGGELTTQ